MASDMTISKSEIDAADHEVRRLGSRPAMVRLSQVEPILVDRINAGMDEVWEVLREKDLLGRVGENLYPTILGVVIVAVQATRYAQYRLWREEFADTRIGQIDPSLQAEGNEGANGREDGPTPTQEPEGGVE
jgi:hypothetical protein